MVKLTSQYIKKIGERSKILNKTHLYLNNKRIDEIADGIQVNISRVSVIYLHDNLLTSAGKLSFTMNLTHLYLQWNKINSVHDLHDFPNLTNLYLGYNCIDILDGLDRVPRLKLLHLENQKLSTNSGHFSFEKETLARLSLSLTELNVSGNCIVSLTDIQYFSKITHLDLSNNLISDIGDVCNMVRKLRNLNSLQIEKNPIIKNRRYENDIIASSEALAKINNKTVSKTNRVFMQALRIVKMQRHRRKRNKKIEFNSETKSFVHQLPPEFKDTAVTGSAIHGIQ